MTAQAATRSGRPEMVQTATPHGHAASSISTQQIIRRMEATYDWTGPDDPDNPRNFPPAVRIFSITVVSSLAFVSAFSGAIYAPAQEGVMLEFHQTQQVAVVPLSLYNLGLAFGPLVGAPLSESYGRKTVFLANTPIFALFMLGAAFSKNIESISVCRFFAGVFASPNISNASATIMDYTAHRYRGTSLGIYYSIPSVASTIAPLVGGFVERALGWRWTHWLAVMIAFALYIPLLFTKETCKKIVLRRRAVRMGLADTLSQQTSAAKMIRHFLTVLVQRPLHMLFTEPIVTLVSMYNGLIYGILYTFVIAVPWIFEHYYGFRESSQSLAYLGVTFGTLLACVPFVLIDFLFYQKRLGRWQQSHDETEPLPPENRLAAAMTGSFLLPASLFIAAWTAEYHVHWLVPVFFQGMTMVACLLVYASASIFMLDAYGPLYGASASSAMMFTRYSLSFAFPMFALRIFQSLGVGWATSTLAFCTLIMAPIPWCFWVFGTRIRARSKYETST